jgi:hypothetical protein
MDNSKWRMENYPVRRWPHDRKRKNKGFVPDGILFRFQLSTVYCPFSIPMSFTRTYHTANPRNNPGPTAPAIFHSPFLMIHYPFAFSPSCAMLRSWVIRLTRKGAHAHADH